MAAEAAFPPLSPTNVAELTDDQVDKQNALKQEGVELLEDEKFEEALGKFSDAIAVGCASALLYSRRAAVLVKLGRPNAVINDCTAALAVNPDSAKAFKMRARANVKLEKWEEAHKDFQTGLNIDFDDQTEDEAKEAAAKAKEIREKVVKERVQKEKDEYEIKLAADKVAYEAAMKARAEVWTDDKEKKYQETCKKADDEKKKKEAKAAAAKETDETRAAAAKETADKEAADKEAAEQRIKGDGGSPLASNKGGGEDAKAGYSGAAAPEAPSATESAPEAKGPPAEGYAAGADAPAAPEPATNVD